METMYPGKVNSPATTLDGGIDNSVTTINIVDGSVLPAAPNIAVIGTEEDAETILYATKVGNELSNVTRGFQGVAKAWNTGEDIVRLFTEYDYASIKANIEELDSVKLANIVEDNTPKLGGTLDTNGKNISFPATQVPSAGVNVLDDYEEGTWTPVIKFGGNSVDITYEVQIGIYTKIGRMVIINCDLRLYSKGTSTGDVTIDGLPFTCKSGTGADFAISIYPWNITFANIMVGIVIENSTSVALAEVTEAGTHTKLNDTDFANVSGFNLTAIYFTD